MSARRPALKVALVLSLVLPAACTAQGAIEGDGSSSPATGEKRTPPGEATDQEPDVKPWANLPRGEDLFRGLPKADFSPEMKTDGTPSTSGFSLQKWDSPIKSQGSRGWCTSFAAVGAMENLIKQGFAETADLSEIDHWYAYQEYNVYSSVQAAKSTAIVPESSWPYWGSPIANYRSTAVARITGYKSLTTRAQVFDAIRAFHPVVIGTDLTDSWQDPGPNGRISSTGYDIGGHALVVVGFQDDGSWGGGGYMLIKNSWGTKWGDLGYARVPYDYCVKNGCYFLEIQGVEYKGKAPSPSPSPSPTPSPSADPTADDIDVEAEHDPADAARFKLHLVERKSGALAQVSEVTYDSHETFGDYEFWTVDAADDGFVTPFWYRTYAHHWRTNGAKVTLKSGATLDLAGAVIDW